jgi:hypothetical protein
MKTLTLFFLISAGVLCSLNSFSQRIKLRGLPHTTDNYLIIENPEDFSTIRINILAIDANGGKEKVESVQLLGQNFYYIKPQYSKSGEGRFEVHIQATNNAGLVTDDLNVPILAENDNDLQYYQWKCVSPTYAYGLTATYVEDNDSFWLDPVFDKYIWWEQSTMTWPIEIEGVGSYDFAQFNSLSGAVSNVPHNDPLVKRYNVYGGLIPAGSNVLLTGIPKKLRSEWQEFQGELGNPEANNHFSCNAMPQDPDELFQNYTAYGSCVGDAVSFANIKEP